MISLKNFEPNLLVIHKRLIKGHTKRLVVTALDILQSKKNDDYENIYSVNPLYLRVNHANEYIEEKNLNKYLIFDFRDENKDLLKK